MHCYLKKEKKGCLPIQAFWRALIALVLLLNRTRHLMHACFAAQRAKSACFTGDQPQDQSHSNCERQYSSIRQDYILGLVWKSSLHMVPLHVLHTLWVCPVFAQNVKPPTSTSWYRTEVSRESVKAQKKNHFRYLVLGSDFFLFLSVF